MEAELVAATQALVWVTGALVLATLVLGVFAFLQWRAGVKAANQLDEQVRILNASLEVSRRTLDASEASRAAEMPFAVDLSLEDHVAGHAVLKFWNPTVNVIVRLVAVDVVTLPDGPVVFHEDLAEGTLGVNDDWKSSIAWDAGNNVGKVLAVRATGQRVGGPLMPREWRFRIGTDGRLDDLSQLSADRYIA